MTRMPRFRRFCETFPVFWVVFIGQQVLKLNLRMTRKGLRPDWTATDIGVVCLSLRIGYAKAVLVAVPAVQDELSPHTLAMSRSGACTAQASTKK